MSRPRSLLGSSGSLQFGLMVTIFFGLLALATTAFAGKPWPFYVPRDTPVPEVESTPAGADWARTEVDAFVLQKLQDKGLAPAKPASRHTLVRRLYFDLLGVPPTPDQVDAFVNNDAPDAYAKLVDQLLDDSRYGERWARFWLDLARYADTAGYEGDPDMPHAWRYRDYVIDAFNKDKPYDLFIKEQIAGDEFNEIMGAGELPLPSAEQTVAMTFLRLAPFTEPRGDETRHEMLSEITSTVGSVFLGLTVGCAKCHDHRHDDIPTADFYRMKAFFATVQIPPPERGDAYQIGGPLDAKFYREGENEWAKNLAAKLRKDQQSAGAELDKLKATIRERLDDYREGGSGFGIQLFAGGNDYIFEERNVADGKPHWSLINAGDGKWSIASDGAEIESSKLGSLSGGNSGGWFGSLSSPTHVSLGQHLAGSGKPKGAHHKGKFAEVLIYNRPLSQDDQSQLAAYVRQKYESELADESADKKPADHPPQSGLRFWLDASDIDGNPETENLASGLISSWKDKVAGIELVQENADLQPKVSTLGQGKQPAIEFNEDLLVAATNDAAFLKDEQGAIVIIYSAEQQQEGYGFEVGGNKQFLSTFVNPAAKTSGDPIDQLFKSNDPRITRGERQRYEFLSTRGRFTKQHLKRLKPVAMSLRHSFGPPYEAGVPVSRVRIRGEYDNPGDVVEPGFLSVITGNEDPAPIRLDPFKRWPTRSRRMTLAKWIASKDNPMTARVMVNRLWHWHFGQGIVRTPSDFGDLSGGPSHRELLDWMAERFMKEKWSIKSMQRLILNSATYRQSSSLDNATAENALANEKDPDNRLLWRFNRRRLEAEAVRDNVLAISGRLNPEQYGLPVFPPLPGDVAEAVKYSESKWDTQYGPEGRRRSLYIYQQRTLTMPLMQTFDALVCDESRPRRQPSVTSLQALAMYNSEFINDEADYFADRVRSLAGEDVTKRISIAFRLALSRPPTEQESQQMQDLVAEIAEKEDSDDGIKGLCRVLYNTNEFLYID